HPHVVDLEHARRLRRAAGRRPGTFRVGLHVKSLRSSMDPLLILPTLIETVAALPQAVLQVNGHRDVLEPGGDRYDVDLADLLAWASRRGPVELRVHDYLSDDELWDYLASLDVSVLPYRFGTHSGWLEACRDLSTTVVAPTCGFYDQQGPVLGYLLDEERFDASSLAGAVRRAYDERPDLGADLVERRAQRDALARTHEEIYAGLLGTTVGGRRCESA
ncbi:MAG: glycosyltransferase family 1 protein, partial [Marmoricola sp.]